MGFFASFEIRFRFPFSTAAPADFSLALNVLCSMVYTNTFVYTYCSVYLRSGMDGDGDGDGPWSSDKRFSFPANFAFPTAAMKCCKCKKQRRQRFQCQHWSFIWLIHDSHSRRKRRMAAEKGALRHRGHFHMPYAICYIYDACAWGKVHLDPLSIDWTANVVTRLHICLYLHKLLKQYHLKLRLREREMVLLTLIQLLFLNCFTNCVKLVIHSLNLSPKCKQNALEFKKDSCYMGQGLLGLQLYWLNNKLCTILAHLFMITSFI